MKSPLELSSHDRILTAAKSLFAQKGYENTSTVAIAREAGTSESQLMKHFGSKQGLLVAILDRGWTGVMERAKATHHASSAGGSLIALLTAATIEFENDREFKTLAALEARRVRKDSTDVVVSRGYRRFRETLDRILIDMRTEGLISADLNLDAVRAAILGFADGLWRDQIIATRAGMASNYSFDDIRQVLELLVDAFSATPEQRARAS
ncbi:MAG TPA: helix-turn-helix domain-containing protein [Candidatus Bathyarchaeia archaeon]|nr:helix-turn-helix domain-containing protein [Candidatus Bathyarchaeia archaeon]